MTNQQLHVGSCGRDLRGKSASPKIVSSKNINDFLHVVDGVITAHVTLHHTSKTEPWFITWHRWKTKNILNTIGQQGILHIMGGSTSNEANTKIILSTLEDNIPIVNNYISIIYEDQSSVVKWDYHDKSKSIHFMADNPPHQRTLVETRSRLEDNTAELSPSKTSQDNIFKAQNNNAAARTPHQVSHVVDLITLDSQNKNTLKTRVEVMEGLAFGETQDGLLVARIKEMEQSIFTPSYTPPNNLTSRLDALALDLGV